MSFSSSSPLCDSLWGLLPLQMKSAAGGDSLPPLQPTYVFRGHPAAIHSLDFLRSNSRLLSGDADGLAILWSLPTKRPVAAWQAHESTIVGVGSWEKDKLITHGREGKLCVWALGEDDEAGMSTQLPLSGQAVPFANPTLGQESQLMPARQHPWLLHELSVPTLNFCSFSSCEILNRAITSETTNESALLIATAGTPDTTVVINHLPSNRTISQVAGVVAKQGKTGMVMCVRLQATHTAEDVAGHSLTLAVGYENGQLCVFGSIAFASKLPTDAFGVSPLDIPDWQAIYTCTPHSQPVLSVALMPSSNILFSCGADSVLAKHTMPTTLPISGSILPSEPTKSQRTGHAGQQSLFIRSDGRIVASAGWDGRARVYSTKTLRELAVCGGPKRNSAIAYSTVPSSSGTATEKASQACYAVAFADVLTAQPNLNNELSVARSGSDARQHARTKRVTETHWLASAGADGRIALWEVY